jgi:hypothetical protein
MRRHLWQVERLTRVPGAQHKLELHARLSQTGTETSAESAAGSLVAEPFSPPTAHSTDTERVRLVEGLGKGVILI